MLSVTNSTTAKKPNKTNLVAAGPKQGNRFSTKHKIYSNFPCL